jgi:hypothetical protein
MGEINLFCKTYLNRRFWGIEVHKFIAGDFGAAQGDFGVKNE